MRAHDNPTEGFNKAYGSILSCTDTLKTWEKGKVFGGGTRSQTTVGREENGGVGGSIDIDLFTIVGDIF